MPLHNMVCFRKLGWEFISFTAFLLCLCSTRSGPDRVDTGQY